MNCSRIWRRLSVLVVAVGLVFAASQAAATTALKLDLDSLVANSDRVVIGQVVEMQSFRKDGRIYTDTTVEIRENWKGDGPEQVTVRQLGGRVGDMATKVSGLARFKTGEESVLFLESTDDDAPYVVTGLAQGKFRVAVGPDQSTKFAIPNVDDLQLLQKVGRGSDADGADSDTSQAPSAAEDTFALRQAGPADIHDQISTLKSMRRQVRALVEDRETDR